MMKFQLLVFISLLNIAFQKASNLQFIRQPSKMVIMGSKKIEATVIHLRHSLQGLKEFVNEVNVLASLQLPNLCKLLGFHAQEGSDERMLIYERLYHRNFYESLYHGNLDPLLHGSSDGPSIDWCARIKVAHCAARGLSFLHEECPFQTSVDLSLETLEKRLRTPKSNVWSFGIVLLELLTGWKNLDTQYPNEERDIIKWSRPFLDEDCRLLLIIDPCIKGRCPPKAARTVADIVLKCLRKDPSQRPTVRTIVESLKNVQDMKHPSGYPLQEPSVVSGKQMLKSQSMNDIIIPTPQATNISPSPPSRPQPLLSPRVSLSIPLPHRTCSTTVSVEDSRLSSMRKPASPMLLQRRVEGF